VNWGRKNLVRRIFFLGTLAIFSGQCPAARAQADEIRVAAAADLQFAMPELAAQFEQQVGKKILVSYGSSGNFFSQIENGAPFDLFFSADTAYPRKLDAAGLAEPGTLCSYAFGHIVIWMSPASMVDLSKEGWNVLLDPAVQKIAIANPAFAPYGRAAVAAMQKAGIYERVKNKLVYGENISQAAQFVQSGNAQAGIIALSLALSPGLRDGKRWEFPPTLYPAIEQGSIVLKNSRNKAAALAFLEFVRSNAGREILARNGFAVSALPSVAAAKRQK
jgi:molybdate transport system substrate-binding protein